MRRLTLAVLIVSLALGAACKRRRQDAQSPNGSSALPATLLSMGDPKTSVQLIRGFYDIEEGSWRWTARQFSVILHPPANGKDKGAVLMFRLNVPAPIIERLKKVTLSAKAGGVELAPETYTTAGDNAYQRDVPASALGSDSVTIEFTLDKAIPPNGADQRELGIVAQAVGLEAK